MFSLDTSRHPSVPFLAAKICFVTNWGAGSIIRDTFKIVHTNLLISECVDSVVLEVDRDIVVDFLVLEGIFRHRLSLGHQQKALGRLQFVRFWRCLAKFRCGI